MRAKLNNTKGLDAAQKKAFSLSKDEKGVMPKASKTMYGTKSIDTGFIKLDQ